MTKEITFRAVPGPAFLERLTVATWLDVLSLDVPIAHVLISHEPTQGEADAEQAEAGLLGMVNAMRLGPAAQGVPDVGARLIMRGPYVALDYGHPAECMTVPPPSHNWRMYVGAGGPACLTIVLDPIPPGAGRDAAEDHLARAKANGRAHTGATRVRN